MPSARRRRSSFAAMMALALCAGACSPRPSDVGPEPSDAAPRVDVAAVCSKIHLADPYLDGIRDGTIVGERLVDGLGDSAAQLKEAVSTLREGGWRDLASAIGRYEHELTRLRVAAQSLEAAEASGEGHVAEAAEHDLDHRVARLDELFRRIRPELSRAGCEHG